MCHRLKLIFLLAFLALLLLPISADTTIIFNEKFEGPGYEKTGFFEIKGAQEENEALKLSHYRWDKSGRTFKTERPNQYVYKSYVGQQNVDLGNGQYAPYLWDEENRVVKFAHNEIHFNSNSLELWRNNEKLQTAFFYPEKNENGIWQRQSTKISDFRIEEIKTTDPTDYLKISYDLDTEDQIVTIAVRVGGKENAEFAFNTKAKQTGEYRLALEQDKKYQLEPIYFSSNDDVLDKAHIGYYSPDKGFYWRWLPSETAEHHIKDTPKKLAMYLNQSSYSQGEIRTLSPDTWGATEIAADADDGFESNETTYIILST